MLGATIEVSGLRSPNGAGKSTAMRVILIAEPSTAKRAA